MSQLSAPRMGAVFSADIAVPEHAQELRFYSRVLTTGESPLWRDDLMNNLGIPIIGLGERNEDFADLPLQWMPHIQVADVATSVERTLDLSGRVLMHNKDDNGTSQWAVLLDPNGAAFGVIPVIPAEAIPPMEAVPMGSISWLDLTVPDASATKDFYQQIVGWSVENVAMNDDGDRYHDYNMLGGDGTPAAGICHARGVNQELPSVWMIYLPVGDLTESLRRVEEEGGKIIKVIHGNDGELVYATIQDPVGVYLALVPG
ncbi:MAG: VOC family protein [Caldilineaceae bacterium]|nr:VOC family protein [Caldilineaceae bacterium]